MLLPTLQSLQELCAIRIAYMMWTRRDVVHRCSGEELFIDEFKRQDDAFLQNLPVPLSSKDELFDEFEDVVLDDVQSLPLPEQLKLRVSNNVAPVGKRLLSFLYLWVAKTRHEDSEEWLTDEMVFECLILNALGLTDERKTAEKILCSRKLPDVLAFRLACVNFLEDEVFKLWMKVRQYFLEKIIQESKQPCLQDKFSSELDELFPAFMKRDFPRTTEPDEVLFWIGKCFSKEKGISMKKIPHFRGKEVDWYEFSLHSAVSYGNVACFDYFSKSKVKYNDMFFLDRISQCYSKDRAQLCLIFQLMKLKSKERKLLLRKTSVYMMSHFLWWPLSLTFVENPEEMWNLIPDEHKSWVFLRIFAILFAENILADPVGDYGGFPTQYFGVNTLTHSSEHLKRIWITLWEISPDSHKLPVLKETVFKSIEFSRRRPGFRSSFKLSGLREKLLRLFLSNGEAVFELYESESMKKSLTKLVAKYMPEDFKDLDNNCISLLRPSSVPYRLTMKREIRRKVWMQSYRHRSRFNRLHGTFSDYISKNYFCQLNR